MFAPHCPVCRRRVLLSTDQIVRYASAGGGRHTVVLRCGCGELLDWDQAPPPAAQAPSPSAHQGRVVLEPAGGGR
jgi:hypothetical protein